MKKKLLRLGPVLLILLALAACGSSPAPAPPPAEPPAAPTATPPLPAPAPAAPAEPPAAGPIAQVEAESSRDSVTVRRVRGQEEGLAAPGQTELAVGEGLAVDETGRAILRFGDLLTVEVLRRGDLLLQELAADQQSALVGVVQRFGTLLSDFNPQAEIDRRLVIQTDFAVITATGTRFLVVREIDSPLEWVIGLDAAGDDLTVLAGGIEKPVETGQARWVAPFGEPSAGIEANMSNLDRWIENAREGLLQPDVGETIWPKADILVDAGSLRALPVFGETAQWDTITLRLDPRGLYGSPTYTLEDCNGDGIQDLAITAGTVELDFRMTPARVRAVDATVYNRAEAGSGVLRAYDPGLNLLGEATLAASADRCEVLSLRSPSGQPYHYARVSASNACLLGISLTPPDGDGEPGPPRPAVESCGQPAARPTATPEAEAAAPALSAWITGITVQDGRYEVTFETGGFEPQLPGQHVHFFYDTVPPEQAGRPGRGPWILYGGPSPFREYAVASRPAGATRLCVLVANPDHSVIVGSGNCWQLP